MSQSTDVTQVVPLAETPQAQVDNEQTQAMPVVTLPAPAVPVFTPMRARLLHLHRVLGRIVSTGFLPTPDRTEMHVYGNGIELLVQNNLDGSALVPFAAVFGGTPTSEDRDSQWAESGRQRYAELLTVIDGVEVRVWSLTDLPVVEQPVAAPVAEASEPEPQHDPAPAPQPEAPAEHPEAA